MDRTVYINIGGKEYPMRFSVGASKALCQKYGSLIKMADKITGKQVSENTEESLDAISWIVELLIKQGCAYKNLFEADLPIPENAPVVDGKYTPPTKEMLEVGLGIWELTELQQKIFETMGAGNKREIEAEAKEKKSKKNE